jgi:SAM-dependent methyltransferase
MALTPSTQYATDDNLRARQHLWSFQDPTFDLIRWVLDLVPIPDSARVLDVGCGNGRYLTALRARGIDAVGCDLSAGMVRATSHPAVAVADALRLPFAGGSFDLVLAPHMLYHVPDRVAAGRELARVLAPGGTCIAVTNGAGHLRQVNELMTAAVRQATPDWEPESMSITFNLENGAEQLAPAFGTVVCHRPDPVPLVTIEDPTVVSAYVASMGDHYAPQIDRSWDEVVAEVHAGVRAVIDEYGAFLTSGDTGAFVCHVG